MSKIVVIGGGASGIMAAIIASINNEVTLLEANEKCGKKILLTGNGRCNYWNSDISIDKYNSDDIEVLNNIIDENLVKEVLNILNQLGICYKIKNGYYYPYSNQASSIRNLLLLALEKRNVKIITNFKVNQIIKNNEKFLIKDDNQIIEADKVILAAGSKACPKSGSDGSSYKIISELGHCLTSITPALVQLIGKDNCFRDWNGVRCESKITLYIDDKKEITDIGEIQLTDYGISGIVTFNISGSASKALFEKRKVNCLINFVPWIETNFYDWFTERNNKMIDHTIEQLLESVIPYKLMHVILKKAKIEKVDKWDKLTDNQKEKLSSYIEEFPLEIIGTNSYDKAQICRGGVKLTEINPKTMESKLVPNLYLVGELLDVDGRCGGFNLAFAFISGYLAGRSI